MKCFLNREWVNSFSSPPFWRLLTWMAWPGHNDREVLSPSRLHFRVAVVVMNFQRLTCSHWSPVLTQGHTMSMTIERCYVLLRTCALMEYCAVVMMGMVLWNIHVSYNGRCERSSLCMACNNHHNHRCCFFHPSHPSFSRRARMDIKEKSKMSEVGDPWIARFQDEFTQSYVCLDQSYQM